MSEREEVLPVSGELTKSPNNSNGWCEHGQRSILEDAPERKSRETTGVRMIHISPTTTTATAQATNYLHGTASEVAALSKAKQPE